VFLASAEMFGGGRAMGKLTETAIVARGGDIRRDSFPLGAGESVSAAQQDFR